MNMYLGPGGVELSNARSHISALRAAAAHDCHVQQAIATKGDGRDGPARRWHRISQVARVSAHGFIASLAGRFAPAEAPIAAQGGDL